ncbi:MAG: Bacterial conjugation TrbI-like protein [Syntrophorhabdaceae bacterium PtaU1.Bin034]|jgi:conjugal transfer pilus assembly protein TraB|nr:MAG: Bacterial conjugation TrbI-like protein [Syntrophorhabdaceae bacterium PtaU1.Bin034]
MTLRDKWLKAWHTLRPDQRKKLVFVGIGLGIVILSLALYKATRPAETTPRQKESKRDISLDKGTLEKSLYNESTRQIGDMEAQLKAVKEQLAALQQDKKPKNDETADLAKEILKTSPKGLSEKQPEPAKPAAPSRPSSYPPGIPPLPTAPSSPPVPTASAIPAPSKPEVYGEIEFVSQRVEKKDEGKKKETTTIYLPPSFMEATLLSGMYAPTAESGKSSPMPALIRIKDLAILPNHVKGDLKGCFVMVEAHGSLADERAHARLTTLSCLTRGGQSVIDQKIKGYVVDEDGFVGLRGKVVSKMGSAIARSLVAGFAVGFGDAMNTSAVTTTTSGLGVTQTLDTDQATKAGMGRGIAQAGRDLQKFLLDLGKQAVPVVEIGAMRPVTVVISEGVEIEIKDIPNTCMGGADRCGN